ncbi:AfsR/SARP family transcriptional regulator [Allonocardiopsis opalescens]|uniref:DNA-binding SARP family transcriptional activator n=1 Tax=Allonocardiopsis opalescens TaxID=1144618 RepID=A0A2T0PPT7_9ACTN|nr:BTAD domain-containing putative transcriptional regulator [Allonocardiopsis opalescens]PRX90746.1 DNA-binding SARP family transcriptional activator [Allonocardiopsis opalescens]
MDFAVLGPVQVRREGAVVPLSRKQRAVLATFLLRPGTVVSRDELVAWVWDEPPQSAVSNVQTYVAQLRRAGVRELHTRGEGYLLEVEREGLDLSAFEDALAEARRDAERGDLLLADKRFGDALELWRGRPAEDAPLSAAAAPRIAELVERAAGARADWVDVRLDLGLHEPLIGELRALTATEPLRERAWYQLMLALYRAGRRGEALDAYHRAREVLVAELGIEPGSELRRLHAAVLDGAASLLPAARTSARKPPSWQGICLLPRDTADFTGRAEELAALTAALRAPARGGPAIAAVTGAPGVGKTTLAVRAAHLLRAAFPDGQLFARLTTAAHVPREPAAVLAELLRALDVDGAVIPESAAERAAMFRARIADRAVLLVLDDAVDEARLEPLLPGTPGSAAVVTSRGPLPALPGAAALRLDVPAEADAHELLAAVAGGDRVRDRPEAARAIVRACGRLPLAIRIAGARLATRPSWPLDDFAARLRDTSARLDELATRRQDVRSTFALSYDALPADARRAFRLLGLADLPSAAEWSVTALTGTSGRAADLGIESLAASGLITASETDAAGQPRYRLHDLLRTFARERGRAEEDERARSGALRRLVAESLHRVRRASAALPHPFAPPPPGSPPRAAPDPHSGAWLAAERENLIATVPLAIDCDSAKAAAELAYFLTGFLDPHGYLDDAVRIWQAVLDGARLAGDTATAMHSRLVLADLAVERRRFRDAMSEYRALLGYFERCGDEHAAAYAMSGLGTCRRLTGAYVDALSDALSDAKRAVERFERLDDGDGLMYAWSNVAAIHLERAEYDAAVDVCRRMLERVGGGEHVAFHARTSHVLGIALYERGDVRRSIPHFEKAVSGFRALGWQRHVLPPLRRLGTANSALGRHDRAAALLDRCRRMTLEAEDLHGEALTAHALGEFWLRKGDHRAALRHFSTCRELLGLYGEPVWRARALRGIAECHRRLGDPAAAAEASAQADVLFYGPAAGTA